LLRAVELVAEYEVKWTTGKNFCSQDLAQLLAAILGLLAGEAVAPGARIVAAQGYLLLASLRLAKTRFLASKNAFGTLIGTELCRRQLKNWRKSKKERNPRGLRLPRHCSVTRARTEGAE